MSVPHLSPELVEMVLQGELPPRTLVTLVRHHLADLCPQCRQAFAELENGAAFAFRARPGGVHSPGCALDGYASAFERAAGQAIAEAGRRSFDHQAAERDLEELLALPVAERRGRLAGARRRFRSRPLAELLLAESARLVADDPAAAGELAELAHEVLLRVPGALADGVSEGLGARALAYRAEALRAAGELAPADRLFRSLRARLASFPLDDPEVHAVVSALEAALRRDQKRWAEAESLLARAVLLHRQALSPAAVVEALTAQLEAIAARRRPG